MTTDANTDTAKTETTKTTKLAKAAAKAPAKIAEATTAPASRKIGKTDVALDMIRAGTTVAQIAERLGNQASAARALIADLRRKGHKIDLGDDGLYRLA